MKREIKTPMIESGIELVPENTSRQTIEDEVMRTFATLFGWDLNYMRRLLCSRGGALFSTPPDTQGMERASGFTGPSTIVTPFADSYFDYLGTYSVNTIGHIEILNDAGQSIDIIPPASAFPVWDSATLSYQAYLCWHRAFVRGRRFRVVQELGDSVGTNWLAMRYPAKIFGV